MLPSSYQRTPFAGFDTCLPARETSGVKWHDEIPPRDQNISYEHTLVVCMHLQHVVWEKSKWILDASYFMN